MKVDQPNLRDVLFDCPWTGHAYGGGVTIRNSANPNIVGLQCAKCGCVIYEVLEASKLVGPGGGALPAAPAPAPEGNDAA